MGCVISSVLKFVLQAVNVVLAVAFLLIALLGILLKTSQSFVQSLVSKIFANTSTNEDTKFITDFILDNASAVSIVLIVGGLVLAAICIVGCISSCCACGILLKVYALIMIILVVVQIIAVSVVFADPVKYTGFFLDGLKDLTVKYGQPGTENELATGVWNFFMGYGTPCCGMTSYEDFTAITGSNFPPSCCKATTTCNKAAATTANVVGCQGKISTLTQDSMKIVMYVLIGAILCQAALIALAVVAICLD